MIDVKRLAVVLHHANAQPPFGEAEREAFYAMKQRILESFGTRDGEDVQHIRKACFACRDGIYVDSWDEFEHGEICRRCNGTGVYSEKWVVLERWKLAGLVFHRPVRTMVGYLGTPTIEGVIRHRRTRLASAAQRVLALVVDPQYYLYLEAWRMGAEDLRRFKAVLAYLLGFDRRKWELTGLRWRDVRGAKLELLLP